jgi:hypothetical protein
MGAQLGGTPVQHVRALRKALQQQGTASASALTLAEQGKCGQAFARFEEAVYWRGLAVAHAAGTGRKSLPRGTLAPLRKLNEARRAVERACVVKG